MSGEPEIRVAEGSEGNAFANMLAELVRQNLASKPHKRRDFDALAGTVALIADDADVAVTLAFSRGALVLHDGVLGVPDVAIRGSADAVMALSNLPVGPLGLPIPRDRAAMDTLREMIRASLSGHMRVHGLFGRLGFVTRLGRVMSVDG